MATCGKRRTYTLQKCNVGAHVERKHSLKLGTGLFAHGCRNRADACVEDEEIEFLEIGGGSNCVDAHHGRQIS